jgi:DNA-3-methyladenine glycosylase I
MKSLLMRNAASHDKRCSWVNVDDPLLMEYHDREWGVPIHNDRKHFEVLVLSGAQAGLNWSLVLKKREGYRRAFDNFDPEKVARYSENQIQTLLADPNIIRNRMKNRSRGEQRSLAAQGPGRVRGL